MGDEDDEVELSARAEYLLGIVAWENKNGRDEPDFRVLGWPEPVLLSALEELYAGGFVQRS